MDKNIIHPNGSRWVDYETKEVWEKRKWGWKFLGYTKTTSFLDITQLNSHECDHLKDLITEKIYDSNTANHTPYRTGNQSSS